MALNFKNAVVSGGNRGIGKAIVRKLAQEGINVAFNFANRTEEAKRLLQEIKKSNIKTTATKVDIKNYQAVSEWITETKEFFGGLDIVINNAGIIDDKALIFMKKEEWQNVLDTNLGGVFNLTQAALMGLMKQKSGVIINISSVSGITGAARQTNYSASKAAIIGFTKALAKELSQYNIRVNTIAPGFIETDMINSLKESYKKELVERIPLKRFGKPEEIANVVNFLISDSAKYITGQTIIVDGGLSMA